MTGTDIATTDPTAVLPLPQPAPGTSIGVADVDAWVARAKGYRGLAQQLVRSFFVPQAYKPQPSPRATPEEVAEAYAVAEANATGAMMLGGSLGLDPLTSLQNIYVVHGRPGMYTKLKVALAQAAGHEVWDEEYGPDRAVVCGRRQGTDAVVRITITMEDARRAGWPEQNANYRKTPADMLWARAASRVVDRIAADVLHGIVSVEDIEPSPERPVQEPRITAAQITATASGASTAEPEPDGGSAAERAVLPITAAKWQAINALFADLGVKGEGQQAARLAVVARLAGREVSRGGELTADEGQTVYDTLAANGPRVCWDVLGGQFGRTDPDAALRVDGGVPVEDPPADGLPDPADGDDPWSEPGADA